MLVLLFAIHDDAFALPAARVEAVLPLLRIAKVPGAPRELAGVAKLHGRPLPVVDLGVVAGGPPIPALYGSRILLVRLPDSSGEKRRIGMLAERVTDLRACPDCRTESFLVDLPLGPKDADEAPGQLLVQWLDLARLVPPSLVETITVLVHSS